MIRLLVPFVLILCLFTAFAAGCRKNDVSIKEPRPDGKNDEPAGPSLADEDPALVEHAKKNNWMLIRDRRIADNRPLIVLMFNDDVKLDANDYKMIAKAKTIQAMDLSKVKNLTDDGLKAIAAIPTLDNIAVGGEEVTDAGIKALAQCKTLEVVTLRSTKKVTSAGVKELAALPKLKELWIQFMEFDGSALAAFAGSKTLQTVNFDWVEGLNDDGVKHLAKLPNLNELKIDTGISSPKFTAAGIKALVDVRLPAKLKIDRRVINDALFESLIAKGWLYGPTPPSADPKEEKRPATAAEVRHINLDGSSVTDKGFQAVLNCTNTESLFLDDTAIGDETLKKLTGFKKLNYLALRKTKVTAAGLEAISTLPIKHLAMQYCVLNEDCFKAFGKMTALEELWLADAKMDAAWLKHIVKLPKLKDLNLKDAALDDASAKLIAQMTTLQEVSANSTKLGNEGFQALLKLPNLRSLYVDGTQVTKEVYQKAKKDHPKMTLFNYAFDR